MHYRILMMSSLPLSAPWNGADKNFGRLIAQTDIENEYIVQTGAGDDWPDHVTPVRSAHVESMPTRAQKIFAFRYLLRYAGKSDLVHIVASLSNPSRPGTALLRGWHKIAHKPVVHTLPSIGDIPVVRSNFVGDVTVVVSKHSQQKLKDHGIPNVLHIYPPLDVSKIFPTNPPEQLSKELALGQNAVLYPAHYGTKSGIKEVIAAFSHLPTSLRDAVLVLACRTHPGQNADDEARQVLTYGRKMGIAERIRIVGDFKDIPALISACSITVLVPNQLTSKMDLPLVVLESLALKRPVILSEQPPLDEALLGGGGFTVPYGNIPALAAAMSKLLTDQVLYERLATQGYNAVRQQCHPDRITEQYREIYHSLMETKEQQFRKFF